MFDIVKVEAQPMIHVTRSASMDSDEIARAMGEAFGAIGAFFGREGITPAGAPLAVYRDWDGATMKIDVGYPVSPADAAKAGGEVASGQTPAGRALKALHNGAYMGLQQTYAAMESHIATAGLKAEGIAWEVYLNDPAQTPEAELVTEVYMRLS